MDFVKNLGLRVGNLAARIPKSLKMPSINLRGHALRVAIYLLYAFILGGVLLIWKFPYWSLAQRLEAAASRGLRMRVELRDLSPSFPLGLKVSRCAARPWAAQREPVLEMTQASLSFRFLPLLRGTVGLVFHGRAYGGVLSGDCSLRPGGDRQFQLKAVLESVRLQEHPGIAQLLGRQVTGVLSGEFQLGGSMGRRWKPAGRGTFQIRQGSWPVDSPYLSVKSLAELNVKATIGLGEGTLAVEECDFKGTGMQGSLKGTVNLAANWSESTLELAGEGQVDGTLLNLEPAIAARVQPLLQQTKPIPFHVRGTLAAPQFSIF